MVKRGFKSLIATGLILALGLRAEGDVNLEWRPREHRAAPGQAVSFGLYAVATGGVNESIGAIDAVLAWDPSVAALNGRVNNGPYRWFSSTFVNDSLLDGLNVTWTDGDAFYTALSALPPQVPAQATPAGLLVSTFGFTANGHGATEVTLPAEYGDFSATRVHAADVPGTFLTGHLGAARIVVTRCDMASDLDNDCDVDLADFELFPICIAGPMVPNVPGENPCDVNDDGRTDLSDYAWFLAQFTGPG